jgi:hypothetical protein
MRARHLIVVLAAGIAAASSLALAAPATGGEGDREVRVRGTCTGAATSKLKLSEENGRIEVEFEVDQNVNGRRWRVTLKRNGVRVFRDIRTTRAPSGSFEVRKLVRDGSGRETITARARALSNGQLCTARARW